MNPFGLFMMAMITKSFGNLIVKEEKLSNMNLIILMINLIQSIHNILWKV